MKITALLVLKCNPDGSDPIILANASDVSHFGYFQRSSVKEFIVFVGRTVPKRTPPGQRQSVQHEGLFFLSGFPSPRFLGLDFVYLKLDSEEFDAWRLFVSSI
ncbi:hypothetical protein MLD38_014950 [Melastoma candidum]|uniref:Uncharacterized protein n=1 Tax=Melastoma candidum TaxID=119954 RepID=A0ACB9REB4_9MYRT|nr:hypothetical protein MLD38_014950 [Melastoma candidum]